jgi:hypothetical protein
MKKYKEVLIVRNSINSDGYHELKEKRMNWNQAKGNWKQFTGKVKEKY